MRFPCRATVVAAPLFVLSGLTAVPTARAHPLGNFSVNHYDGLRLSHDRIEDTAVVDSAEIPTAQDEEATDTDHDGTIAPAEAADRAAGRCARLADRADVERTGWREITAVPGDRVGLVTSSVPSKSPSDGLRRYPGEGSGQSLSCSAPSH